MYSHLTPGAVFCELGEMPKLFSLGFVHADSTTIGGALQLRQEETASSDKTVHAQLFSEITL